MHINKNDSIRLLLVSAILASCFGCAVSPAGNSIPADPFEAGNIAYIDFIEKITPVLLASDSPIRVNFEGSCSQKYEDRLREVIFPQLSTMTPQEEGSDVERLRSIFRNDASVNVSKGDDSIIRVRIGDPNEDILTTRIKTLSFTIDEQYTAILAAEIIAGAPEVLARAEEWGYKHTLYFRSTLIGAHSDDDPHLPETLEDITMDEALDLHAVTFGYIVFYGACADRVNVFVIFRGE